MFLSKNFEAIKHYMKLYQMGFIKDQEGIINRYVREKDNWNDHLKKTKQFILESAQSRQKNKVIVLGSGWLLDLPIDKLSKQFKEVLLVDIFHPRQVLHRIEPYKNVKIIHQDITGRLINFFHKNKKKKSLLTTINSFSYKAPNADLIISLNIMCQLHILLINYIKRFNQYNNTEIRIIEKEIQQSHLNSLPQGKTCLVTDVEEEIYDKNNHIIGINPLIHINLPDNGSMQKWQWKFDTQMRYRKDAKTFFNTIAIEF